MDVHLPGCKKLALPLDEAALDRLETLLQDREIAAFIMEPTIMNLNVIVPSLPFMQGLVDLCHEYGTLVIADEVASGFGRTGALFASEHYGLEPDIMTLAKAVTSGVAPLGATLVTNDVAKQIEDELDFYSTFGWHPLAVEAALATTQYWGEHKAEILQNVADREAELRHQLSIVEWRTENVELRIQGLAAGIGLGDEEYAKHIEEQCRGRGLLVGAEEDSLALFPPLTIDHETMAEALEIIAQAAQR
jgi:adenosylmethionine-8-amino-7-oxononanoate aminotransferase